MSNHTSDPNFRYPNDNRASSASYSAYPSQGEPPPGTAKGEISYYPNDNGGFYANSNRLNSTSSDAQYPNSNYKPDGAGSASSPNSSASTYSSSSSLQFNKANSSYLEIGDISSIAANKEELSFSLWFNLTGSLSSYHGLLGSQTNKLGEIYYNEHNQNLSITTLSNPNNTMTVSGPASHAPIVQNRWFFLVMTFKLGSSSLYLYDASTRMASISSRNDTETETHLDLFNGLSLGANRRWGNYGSIIIDEFALFSYELTANEILNIAQGHNKGASLPPNPQRIFKAGDLSTFNPIGWWRMGEDNGPTTSTITDLGQDALGNPSDNHGTINGATFSTNTPS